MQSLKGPPPHLPTCRQRDITRLRRGAFPGGRISTNWRDTTFTMQRRTHRRRQPIKKRSTETPFHPMAGLPWAMSFIWEATPGVLRSYGNRV
ncbi:MAG: hypothetical protein MZV64_59290 [Ignavibacteriales bacterium]|nr:hypothetical protein [Ignavibacteriales bacterium]